MPELGYRRAREAIGWLTVVLGLKEGVIIDGPDGSVAHAELWWHSGVVFVESLEPADEVTQTGHATICLASESSEEVDDIYARAIEHGAQIVLDLADTPFGSYQFAVRDLEDNIWTVDTYQPSVPVRRQPSGRVGDQNNSLTEAS
jgi:uncharacterized glyoxalase superfamily protein PhnB